MNNKLEQIERLRERAMFLMMRLSRLTRQQMVIY